MNEEISKAARTEIDKRLSGISSRENVRILFACESGSRAWGFPSVNSDYDVRFLYLRKPDWYLSIEQRSDVIELPIADDYDINGWDLKKALVLFRKSNPPLLEWLGSSIVYSEDSSFTRALRDLQPTYYSPRSCLHHYLHMAKNNFREFLQGQEVVRKKYLYVLRPIVAIRWIEMDLGMVPTRFQTLVDKVVESPAVRSAIHDLLVAKIQGKEMDRGPRIPTLSRFLEQELTRLERLPEVDTSMQSSWVPLNELFRNTVRRAWREDYQSDVSAAGLMGEGGDQVTFIDWSDSNGMFELLVDFVANERADCLGDSERGHFLSDLLAELQVVEARLPDLTVSLVIQGLRDTHESADPEFAADPVMVHLKHCIEELERVENEGPV